MNIDNLYNQLQKLQNPQIADNLARFFKTKPGEYGYGDVFIGIKVPTLRQLARKFKDLSLDDTTILLNSQIHEHRLLALFLLIHKYEDKHNDNKAQIFDMYIQNIDKINNWDLVDLSAPNIIGKYLLDKPRDILYQFANSAILWHRRIAIVSTYTFIRQNQYDDTLQLAKILLNDNHDLIHKAVGWMLREIGKRNLSVELDFLHKHYRHMPRKMLRYAIEKFEEPLRQKFLKNLV